MKKLAWVVLVLTAPLVAAAQDKDKARKDAPPPPAARGQLPAHYKKLGLSDTQLAEVRRIRGQSRARIERLREELRQAQTEERAALEKVLTEEQRKRLRELRAGAPAGGKAKEK